MNGDGAVSLGDEVMMTSAMSRACREACKGPVHVRIRYSKFAAGPDLCCAKRSAVARSCIRLRATIMQWLLKLGEQRVDLRV